MTISLISTTPSTAFGGGSTNKVTASVSWAAGDIVTVWGFTSDNANTLTNPPTATGLTFTNRLLSNVASRIKLYCWTAIAATSGSSTVASTASFDGGIVVRVYRGTGTLSLGTISSLGSGTSGGPNVSYTIGATGSLVDGGWGDWNAVAGARTYRTTNLGTATEDHYFTSGTFATVGSWHNAATTATGAQTIGLTAPTATAWLCAGLEIKETGGGAAVIPLDAAAATSSATLSLTAQTAIALGTSAAQSSATLALSAQPQVPLQAAAATAAATLALTAPTTIALGASAAQSATTLALTAGAVIVPLGAAAAASSATLALTAQTQVPLGSSAAQSTATLALTAQTQVPLGAAAAVSTTTLALTAGGGVVTLQTSVATSAAILTFRVQTQIPLGASTGTSGASLLLTAATRIALQPSAAAGGATLSLFTPTPAPVVLGAAHAISTASLVMVQMGRRWPAHTGARWDMDPASRWQLTPGDRWPAVTG